MSISTLKKVPAVSPKAPSAKRAGTAKRASAMAPAPSQQPVLSVVGAQEIREVRHTAGTVVQAAMEVLAGTRPSRQLSRWLEPNIFAALELRATISRNSEKAAGNRRKVHANPAVRSVHASQVCEGVYELALLVREDTKARAVAVRLEQRQASWCVTALEIG
ncbi:Rv3235 family protein [Pseudarthrobacter sp. J1738]|uniref:Rv3235 family protein n=1 Tax=unclassified Pseudarthrobacter TaxID=2647000 RepID=UPI003D274958